MAYRVEGAASSALTRRAAPSADFAERDAEAAFACTAALEASSAALSCEASASSLGGNFRPVERGAVSSPDSLSAAETVAAMRAVVPSAGRIPVEGSSAVSPPDTFL
ncbi:hypothetical protein cyc_01614 [Cyclospora cayetanensis]|uniref:Uncharacterized protein n=1 Tax=Cyclospora cayetanensis TaxID=88456 RepID=A0A1D3CWN5_9EIME|nr:hypothetical protein cyc_01614 [Cyclospora cayetanensis]